MKEQYHPHRPQEVTDDDLFQAELEELTRPTDDKGWEEVRAKHPKLAQRLTEIAFHQVVHQGESETAAVRVERILALIGLAFRTVAVAEQREIATNDGDDDASLPHASEPAAG